MCTRKVGSVQVKLKFRGKFTRWKAHCGESVWTGPVNAKQYNTLPCPRRSNCLQWIIAVNEVCQAFIFMDFLFNAPLNRRWGICPTSWIGFTKKFKSLVSCCLGKQWFYFQRFCLQTPFSPVDIFFISSFILHNFDRTSKECIKICLKICFSWFYSVPQLWKKQQQPLTQLRNQSWLIGCQLTKTWALTLFIHRI